MPKKKAKINLEEDRVLSPAGLKVIKTALVIMTILIVAGLGLLVYGFKAGLNEVRLTKTESTLFYPENSSLTRVTTTPQGEIRLEFLNRRHYTSEILTLSPDGTRIISHVIIRREFGTDNYTIR